MTWPFDDPPHVVVFTTKSIAFRQRPVLLVTHDEEDGAWQFLPREGAGHEQDREREAEPEAQPPAPDARH